MPMHNARQKEYAENIYNVKGAESILIRQMTVKIANARPAIKSHSDLPLLENIYGLYLPLPNEYISLVIVHASTMI